MLATVARLLGSGAVLPLIIAEESREVGSYLRLARGATDKTTHETAVAIATESAEHAQHLSPADIPRFAELGVIASMQGIHCTSDGPWVVERIGERRAAEGAYVWRSLLDSGAVVSNGTDTPVESVDPIPNFRALVTRRMANGEAFHPEQRMTRMEALRASTLSAAYAAFEDDVKGSLAPGKLADVVVLSRDILTVPDDEILDARVVYTVLGGRVVYESPGSAAKE